jgi:hypothetical protein
MRRLLVGVKVLELSEENYLNGVRQLARGFCTLANSYHSLHVSGFSDLKGLLQPANQGQNDFSKAIEEQIDDDELSKEFDALSGHLQELRGVDKQISEWLAQFCGLASVQNKRGISILEKRLEDISVNGPEGHYQGPVWAMKPEYQNFISRSSSILDSMNEMEKLIDRRIDELLKKIT